MNPLTITQTLVATGIQTQIEPFAAAQAHMSSWPWLAVQTTQTGKLQWQQNPMDANIVTGNNLDLSIHRLLVATWAMDINIDAGCGRTMNPNMTLSCRLVLNIIMAPGECTVHPH